MSYKIVIMHRCHYAFLLQNISFCDAKTNPGPEWTRILLYANDNLPFSIWTNKNNDYSYIPSDFGLIILKNKTLYELNTLSFSEQHSLPKSFNDSMWIKKPF